MHPKVFVKLKKTLKTLPSGQKNPKKPKKNQKTQKKPKKPKKTYWAGFFKKTRVFSNPDFLPFRWLWEQKKFGEQILSENLLLFIVIPIPRSICNSLRKS